MLAGCSTSRLTTSWAAPQAVQQGRHFDKVLVLGLLSNRNRAAKVDMENALAQNLRAINVNAVTATDLYGPTAFRGMSERKILRHLRSENIDGVITIALIDKNTSRNFSPGYSPYFWGYWSFYSPYMWGGYYYNSTSYSFETNLYDMHMQDEEGNDKSISKTGNLLYSAQSESVDPNSPEQLGYDFAKTIVRDLKAKNILR
jgi:hypothetical protein